MHVLQRHLMDEINSALEDLSTSLGQPDGLYEPIRYGLRMGGKRLRPLLTLVGYRMICPEGSIDQALKAAMALEVFHNFTLLHDDLMDDAPLRRGKPTVYHKWDANTAILSGDAMMIVAYQRLSDLPDRLLGLVLRDFNDMALKVCEGQQYDMDFESRRDVSVAEYMMMIQRKTACLIAASLKMGAVVAGASETVCRQLYEVGEALGLAFQLMDDYLDVWGDETFGKRRGGDILEEKKTWLLIRALEIEAEKGGRELGQALELTDEGEKIAAVTTYYERHGLREDLLHQVSQYSQLAVSTLDRLTIDPGYKSVLIEMIEGLNVRKA